MTADAGVIDTLAPGLYLDCDGDSWAKRQDGGWYYLRSGSSPSKASLSPVVSYGPLIPVPWPPADPEPVDQFADAVYSAGALAADVARIPGGLISITVRDPAGRREVSIEVAR